jgi:hypothetical protein
MNLAAILSRGRLGQYLLLRLWRNNTVCWQGKFEWVALRRRMVGMLSQVVARALHCECENSA